MSKFTTRRQNRERHLLATPVDQSRLDCDPLVVVVTPHKVSRTRASAHVRTHARCDPVKRQRVRRLIDLVSV